ncbi:MAG: S9 family peptidase [Anaerolineae bacterium]|nr:S9 family peptidase [Anaerolineae bacterium]
MSRFTYPFARTADVIDDYHGTPVPDPYRWLETPDSPETQAFIAAQNTLTEDFLSEIPAREGIRQRLTELWNYAKYSAPSREGEHYYFFQNDGLQNQAVMYRLAKLDDTPVKVLDPNTLSDDGTVALVGWHFTKDGERLAYATAKSGSDAQEIRIMDVDTGETYPESLQWCRFSSVAWLTDKSGFFYNRYPDPATVAVEDQQAYNRLYFHQVGTPQSEDVLIYERPDAKELNFDPTMTDDGQYIILNVWHGAINRNRVYYRRVDDDGGDFIRLLDAADADYNFIGNKGARFYFNTDLDAPRSQVIAIDVEQQGQLTTILPESADVISFVRLINGRFVVVTMHDACHRLHLYDLDGSLEKEIELPVPGTVENITGSQDDTEFFFSFVSYLYPSTSFRYDFNTGELSIFRQPKLNFDFGAYVTRQVFATSKDGTRIPLFMTHKADLQSDGNTPTILYGYGGFSVSLTPWFYVHVLNWLEKGGIYVEACLRGGNEYGEAWHQAGMLANKQNVFDDFISAGEWLIANHYTNSKRLAIMGGSNGGLLVAACMLQRPELFGAVICQVPVTDMLRYHKFTAGRYWTPEYGNAEENPEHFEFMVAYSPTHQVKPGVTYPPLLIHTAESDDRVVPMHSLKFAAAVQASGEGVSEKPLLLQVEVKAGHGLGKPTSKLIAQYTDFYAFLMQIFEMH